MEIVTNQSSFYTTVSGNLPLLYYVQNKLMILLYSWIFFLNTAVLYWLLRGHMTSINKAVSRQKFLRGQDRKVSKPSFINWSLSVEASRQLIVLMHQYIHVAHVFNMVEPLPRTVRSATQRMESFFYTKQEFNVFYTE